MYALAARHMKIKTRLVWAFGIVTLTTLALSALGFLQTRKLSSALYEIAVVRMPSVEALKGIEKAMIELNSFDPPVDGIANKNTRAWAEFQKRWDAYEILPQTAEEAAAWRKFASAAKDWRNGSTNAYSTGISLLREVIAINDRIVAEQKAGTIARFEDAQRDQRFMLAGGLGALVTATAAGFIFGRSLTEPLRAITESLNQIAQGNLDIKVPITSNDELGEVARATNQMVIERKRVEESLRDSREQLRALAGRLQAVREDERVRIAREIHDVLAQDLTRLKFGIASIGRRVTVGPIDYCPPGETPLALSGVADSAIQTVQKIAAELRPVALDSLGLAAAIEWQAEEFQRRTAIQCDAVVPEEEIPLDQNAATNVFRIVQESLTNVLRHAAATRVEIILEQNENGLLLIIQDNGKGYDPSRMKDPNSLGLLGMRERAAMLHGVFKITGSPGTGTEVRVTIPLPDQSQSPIVDSFEPAVRI